MDTRKTYVVSLRRILDDRLFHRLVQAYSAENAALLFLEPYFAIIEVQERKPKHVA